MRHQFRWHSFLRTSFARSHQRRAKVALTNLKRRQLFSLPLVALTVRLAFPPAPALAVGTYPGDTDWVNYGRDLANTRYAPLDQINAGNFNDLEVAWRFSTASMGPYQEYNLQGTPLVAKGVLYATAGSRRNIVALNAATGEILWIYRMDEGTRAANAPRKLSGRGLAYWTDGVEERILYVTIGYRLVALDAKTGRPVPGFGIDGVVDLKLGLDQNIDPETADIGLHATPCIANDVVVIGAAHSAGLAPKTYRNVKGYVRGFDVRTGKRLWIFHTIPQPGEYGFDSWLDGTDQIGNAGVWCQISADPELNLVYLGVEAPTGDTVGLYRRGAGLFGETIVALNLRTGERVWHYQTIHHGLWDRDIPCAPILCDVPIKGRIRKVLAQPTKQAWLYVLDRETGKPIWPIPERPVPAGAIPGEYYAPTQPVPSRPPAYDVQGLEEHMLIDFTPDLRTEAKRLVANYQTGSGPFIPPSDFEAEGTWGTISVPGFAGGTNWPGGCYDPETQLLYVYSATMPHVLIAHANKDKAKSDFDYVGAAYSSAMSGGKSVTRNGFAPGNLTVRGLPLLKPPYGRITAIDLSKGEIVWQIAHGETPDEVRNHPALKALDLPRTGQAGLLGPTVTKSLVICGDAAFTTRSSGGRTAMLRAYDKSTGREVGAVEMSAPQTGVPMTYMLKGRQYIVLAIGGGGNMSEYVAYRLPV